MGRIGTLETVTDEAASASGQAARPKTCVLRSGGSHAVTALDESFES
jgi:hypothetical protein